MIGPWWTTKCLSMLLICAVMLPKTFLPWILLQLKSPLFQTNTLFSSLMFTMHKHISRSSKPLAPIRYQTSFKVHMSQLPFSSQKSAVARQFEWYMCYLQRINTSREILAQTCQKIEFLTTWPGGRGLSTNRHCDVKEVTRYFVRTTLRELFAGAGLPKLIISVVH